MNDSTLPHGIFNRYSLVARVYPALLALAPILWSAVVLFPKLLSDFRSWSSSILAIGCSLYLLASISRACGKKAERKLYEVWGGWPTTMLLRHRDTTIDPITKARYHKGLLALQGVGHMPTVNEEISDPIHADNVYWSATKHLIELRRSPKNHLLEYENASYGFRRNLFGLKWLSVSIAFVAATVTALVWWAALKKPIDVLAVEASIVKYPYLPVLMAADLGYLTLIGLMIDGEFVRQAADEYAFALLRTLEPDPPR